MMMMMVMMMVVMMIMIVVGDDGGDDDGGDDDGGDDDGGDGDGNSDNDNDKKTVHSTHILPVIAKQQLLDYIILFVHHSYLQTIHTSLHPHQRICTILKKKRHNISVAIHASNM